MSTFIPSKDEIPAKMPTPCTRGRQDDVSVGVHMALTPPPSTCVHLSLTPSV